MEKLNKKIKILNNTIPALERGSDEKGTELFSFYDLLKIVIKEKRQFRIPIYQRKYSWNDDQRKQFTEELENETWDLISELNGITWSDISFEPFTESYKIKNENIDLDGDNAQSYYGILYLINNQLVNRNGYKTFEVVDGQQRITTLYLMLLSVYTLINSGKNKAIVDSISNSTDFDGREIIETFINAQLKDMLFLNKNMPLSIDNFRLQTLNKEDEKTWRIIFKAIDDSNNADINTWDISEETFKHFITKNGDILEAEENINGNIIDGYKYFDEYFRGIASDYKQKGLEQFSLLGNPQANKDRAINNDLYKLILYVLVLINGSLKSFKIAIFDIVEEASAPIIFETINSKGTPLTSFDILKSKLFKDIDKENPNYEAEENRIKEGFDKLETLMNKNFGKKNKGVDPKMYDSMLVDSMKFLLAPLKNKVSDVSKNSVLDEISKYLDSDSSSNKSEKFIEHLISYNEAYDSLWSQGINDTKSIFRNEDDFKLFLELKNNVKLFKASTFKSLFAGFIARSNEMDTNEEIRTKRNSSYLTIMNKLFNYMVYNWRVKGVKANQFDIPLRKLACTLDPDSVTKVLSKIELNQTSDKLDDSDLINDIVKFDEREDREKAIQDTTNNDYDNKDILGSFIFNKIYFADNKDQLRPNQLNTVKNENIYKILSPSEAQAAGIPLSVADKLGSFFITNKSINGSIIKKWTFEELENPKNEIKLETLNLDKKIYGEYSVVGKQKEDITLDFINKRNEIISNLLRRTDIYN